MIKLATANPTSVYSTALGPQRARAALSNAVIEAMEAVESERKTLYWVAAELHPVISRIIAENPA